MAKSDAKKPTQASMHITLEVALDIGSTTLEAGLAHARTLKIEDVIDIEGLDLNDYSIEVKGVWQ